MIASWNYETNITDGNLAVKLKVSNQASEAKKKLSEKIKLFPWRELKDKDAKRQFFLLSNIWENSLPSKQYKEFDNIVNQMKNIYSSGILCDPKNMKRCDSAVQLELWDIIPKSRNPKFLLNIWKQWRKVTGKKMKQFYPRYVELGNIASKLNNFPDKSVMWLQQYETKNFQQDIENLWRKLKPLFLQIHAYVRGKLNKKYGDAVVSKDGPIPAHLVGDMWAASWENIADFTLPFPGKKLPDATAALVAQKYDALKMFKLAESSFMSMNMSAMPKLFWKNSLMVKPTNREVDCESNAWEFSDGKDFRVKVCTEINSESLETIHHEMSHVEYDFQLKDLPAILRDGTNPGFHEGIADVMGLSVLTPGHLQKIKLLKKYTPDKEASLNHLYRMSLEKVAFLPYTYIMDLWRWDIFRGKTTKNHYNCQWWKLVEEYQGIEPPVDRSEEDLDPVSQYHVAADYDYLRYFVGLIIQFEFHRSLCIEAGEFQPKNPKSKPLHECDITASKKAGNLFKSVMKMSGSKPWLDAMKLLTGEAKLSSSGILDYFKPLEDWLTAESKRNKEFIGWKKSRKRCLQTRRKN
ncbi:angiotensin-converting enzyme-like [Belonocnema kinseyi]|uniref:angiotensin-converting enzyme-like n=1 Tax=Belonocnema kinseyi TaxID=2817044 RepID=UPI00143DAF04|nr:angiotensin-converting enzyme-like [Belonocnema kinseyi]